MGIDVLIPAKLLMEKEGNRLLFNLGILCAVSILTMSSYFIQSGSEYVYEEQQGPAAVIGTGYIIIMLVTIVYIVLYIFTCDKCTDRCCTRLIIALGLIIGGLITAIGYWVYAGETSPGCDDPDCQEPEEISYFVGYTILIGGLCTIWALDIAWDDVKNVK